MNERNIVIFHQKKCDLRTMKEGHILHGRVNVMTHSFLQLYLKLITYDCMLGVNSCTYLAVVSNSDCQRRGTRLDVWTLVRHMSSVSPDLALLILLS